VSRYLVTGCAGFIGSHLVEALLARGDDVLGLDVFSDFYAREAKRANLSGPLDDGRFELVESDLGSAKLDSMAAQVDGIFHLAAQPGVRGSWGDSFSRYVHDNILASQRLFEAAARARVRVVFASSSSVYGNAERSPTREDDPCRPLSPYGVTKLTCEQLAGAYALSLGLEVVGLRYFTVYGPRQRPDMLMSRILAALLEGHAFDLHGEGLQTRDFTFISDAVTATVSAMSSGAPGFYNVGGGRNASVREVMAICELLAGSSLEVHACPPARGDVASTSADTTRIREAIGWKPTVELEEGLDAQFRWSLGRLGPR
jgi:nucleoside-diphosphate-sugar epimerase